jgi:hypothetical protein
LFVDNFSDNSFTYDQRAELQFLFTMALNFL